jgi:hypothetical protein
MARSLENVLKRSVYCTSVEKFAAVNAIYAKGFTGSDFRLRTAWPGPFDIEIDCIAAVWERAMFSVLFEVHPKPTNGMLARQRSDAQAGANYYF